MEKHFEDLAKMLDLEVGKETLTHNVTLFASSMSVDTEGSTAGVGQYSKSTRLAVNLQRSQQGDDTRYMKLSPGLARANDELWSKNC